MQRHPLYAAGLMALAMFAFASMTAVIRLLSASMATPQIVLLRNLFGLAIAVAWAVGLARGRPDFSTRRLGGHFWRSCVGIVSMQIWFYALSIMPLALATALSFTSPIFATLLAIVFLKEKVGPRRWAAIAIGLAGVLVMLRPDAGALTAGSLLVLLSSALIGWVSLLVKSLTATESPETITFYMTLFMLILSLPPGLMVWQPASAHQLWLAFLVALLSIAAHLMIARAYRQAEITALMPLDFLRLVFACAYAYALFGETPDNATLLGAGVIVASSVYIAHRETLHRRRGALQTAAKEGDIL